MGIETFTGLLKPGALDEADEIFSPARRLNFFRSGRWGDRILNEVPGPLTRRFSERMETITSGRDEQFRHWLFPA